MKCLRNDLFCVEWDIKPQLSQSTVLGVQSPMLVVRRNHRNKTCQTFHSLQISSFTSLHIMWTDLFVVLCRSLLQSSDTLQISFFHQLAYYVDYFFGIPCCSPLIWYSPPSSIHSFQTIGSFQKHFKMYIFQSAFINP